MQAITDPMTDLTSILPKFEKPATVELRRLEQELGRIVFSERHHAGTLSVNDLSDLRHLATAIHHSLRGLITSDASVLNAAIVLREKFNIEVLSPAAFSLDSEIKVGPGAHGTVPDSILNIEELHPSLEEEVRALLSRLDIGRGAQSSEWAAINGNDRVCHRYIVRSHSHLVSYLVWPNIVGAAPIDARLAIDEGSLVAADAARLMLEHVMGQVELKGVARIRLRFPVRQVVVREVADALGFTKSSDSHSELQKIVLNGIVTTENWNVYRSQLLTASNVKLPDQPPVFRNVDQQIEVHSADGNRVHLTWLALESFLSPALFCLPGRDATLTPLRREYAEHLLRHLPQSSFLPQARAQLFRQRHFINGPQARSAFSRGGLIVFYESGKGKGFGAVVALARVVRTYQREDTSFAEEDFEPSVLDAEQLASIGKSRTRTVTVFDNLQILPRPVPLATLQRLGCGASNQLITSRRLSNDQVQGILHEGLK